MVSEFAQLKLFLQEAIPQDVLTLSFENCIMSSHDLQLPNEYLIPKNITYKLSILR